MEGAGMGHFVISIPLMVEWHPPWEKQFAFENRPFAPQKERIVFQPSIFAMLDSGTVSYKPSNTNSTSHILFCRDFSC